MIVIDASTIVSAALFPDSVPGRALVRARAIDVLAVSVETAAEISEVLARPKFTQRLPPEVRRSFLELLFRSAAWFEPRVAVADCRDINDNKYLELVLESEASTLVSSDSDLLSLHPWRGIPILSPADYMRAAIPPLR